jgi:hypothetical protein
MFPDDMEDNFRNNSFEHPSEAHTRHPSNPETDKPIPIRVVHERTSNTPPKNRMNATSSRNTTEIPAARANHLDTPNNISADKSPRLERAHSEPPKLFNQRLRAGGASSPQQPSTYSTIPENSEPTPVGSRSPRFSTAPESKTATPNHKLSSSASSPSVPASNTPPTAPPRRNKLDRDEDKPQQQQQQQPQQQQNSSQSDAPKIRHIPIFVEGRDEPVSQRKISGGDSGFRQPSEFYPPNVQKVRSQSVSSPGVGAGSGPGFGRGLNLKPQQQQQRPLEPTSPLSPPPSDQPIPMGCSNYFINATEAPIPEPSSPAPPPPGPIPMPFCPSDVVDAPAAPEVYTIPVKVVDTPEPAKPEPKPEQNDQKNLTPAEAKMRKIEAEVEELLQRVEKFAGCKKDKEYLFLDDLLTQKLCILDGIESDGREDIRKMRRDSIKTITRCLSMLDRRATPVASQATVSDDAEVANKVLSDLANLDCQEKSNNKEQDEEKVEKLSDEGPKKNK